jgi:ABC-2 type transport system ATP-binding protein
MTQAARRNASALAIETTAVSRRFGDQLAVDEVSLTVRPGEVLGLVGPNGAGKTTMVRLLTGLLQPSGGAVQVFGLDPLRDGEEVRRHTGVLTESAGHYRHLTGLQELEFFARVHELAHPTATARGWLEAVGLGSAIDQKVGGYSTGMARRLGLARAMLHRPRLLLLDEPTSGLDPGGIRHVLELLADQARAQGTTVVLCSHVLSQLESVCQRYAVMREGKLLHLGSVEELADQLELPQLVRLRLRGAVPATALGLGLTPLGQDRYEARLAQAEQLPALVAALAGQCEVWQVEMQERDLEHVYFKLMGPPA